MKRVADGHHLLRRGVRHARQAERQRLAQDLAREHGRISGANQRQQRQPSRPS